ncbi:patatin-like phospholipase family protein [Rhodothermus bifroesti]|uniref:patatin-like phospholipase family protein n=1 Tax=Rhodothermus bifroesti TaxID=2823335 RepID=UPI001AEFBC55|nr:patatin-like phospholipase family protein [Rhodothermus bifroesti]
MEPAARQQSASPALGLALGGGGMRGWAHIGVLSVLERYGLRPGVVAGCSAGALIGAFYAFGYSVEQMKQLMREQRTRTLFSIRLDGQGLISNEPLRDYLRRHLHDCCFEDLPIPFYVIATDLESGKEVVLSRGPVVEAILASSAIPGIFAPLELGGRLLVDGGLCNNVPVSPLVHHGARYTIAVRLHRERSTLEPAGLKRRRSRPEEERRISLSMWSERFSRTFRTRRNNRQPNSFEVLGRAMEIVVTQLEGYRLQACRPDVLIVPEVDHVGMLSLWEEKEDIFQSGVRAAEAQAEALKAIAKRLVPAKAFAVEENHA